MDDIMGASGLEERMVIGATEKRLPISGAFELLPMCNLSCPMCYIRQSREECAHAGGIVPADEWLRIAGEMLDAGTLFLLLTGGEPLLYPDFFSLYQKLYEMGFVLTINTNGTLIGEEEAHFFEKYLPRRVNVTLYGTTPETYRKVTGQADGFEKTIRGIRMLKAAGVPVKMNVSLIGANASELEHFYRIAEELDVPLELNTYMFPAVRNGKTWNPDVRMTPADAAKADLLNDRLRMSEERYKRWIYQMAEVYQEVCAGNGSDCAPDQKDQEDQEDQKEPEAIPCRAGRSSFWISWKEELSPCVFLDAPAHGAVSLEDHGFAEAWASVTNTRDGIFLPGRCTSCKMRSFCQICCAAAWHENHDFSKAPEYLCEMTKEKMKLAYEASFEDVTIYPGTARREDR